MRQEYIGEIEDRIIDAGKVAAKLKIDILCEIDERDLTELQQHILVALIDSLGCVEQISKALQLACIRDNLRYIVDDEKQKNRQSLEK